MRWYTLALLVRIAAEMALALGVKFPELDGSLPHWLQGIRGQAPLIILLISLIFSQVTRWFYEQMPDIHRRRGWITLLDYLPVAHLLTYRTAHQEASELFKSLGFRMKFLSVDIPQLEAHIHSLEYVAMHHGSEIASQAGLPEGELSPAIWSILPDNPGPQKSPRKIAARYRPLPALLFFCSLLLMGMIRYANAFWPNTAMHQSWAILGLRGFMLTGFIAGVLGMIVLTAALSSALDRPFIGFLCLLAWMLPPVGALVTIIQVIRAVFWLKRNGFKAHLWGTSMQQFTRTA